MTSQQCDGCRKEVTKTGIQSSRDALMLTAATTALASLRKLNQPISESEAILFWWANWNENVKWISNGWLVKIFDLIHILHSTATLPTDAQYDAKMFVCGVKRRMEEILFSNFPVSFFAMRIGWLPFHWEKSININITLEMEAKNTEMLRFSHSARPILYIVNFDFEKKRYFQQTQMSEQTQRSRNVGWLVRWNGHL